MKRQMKLIHLYIIPLLIVALSLLFDKGKLEINKLKPFAEVAKETSALSEVDQRILTKATVKHVVDGDTIQLETGEKVRYVGIDTPETKHPKKSVQCFGREASAKNKELVEGREILMEKDISNTDRYGRLLRYIYLPNPDATDEAIFVNEYLVEQGYAHLLTYPPDVKYDKMLKDAQTIAREEKRGLWGHCDL
jgi:micrococcal nuclease